jgi:Uma2 family endonuclease
MAHETVAPWGSLVPDAPYPMTADELLRLPDEARGQELVQGRLLRMPPTGIEHSDIAGNLYTAVRAYVRAGQLGTVTMPETGFIISQPGEADTVLAPDVAFVAVGRLPAPGTADRRSYPRLAPDLVVEVASPSQYKPEVADKARAWLAAGVRLVWIVWPGTREVDIWRPGASEPTATITEAGALDGMDVLPGFTYPAADLFA